MPMTYAPPPISLSPDLSNIASADTSPPSFPSRSPPNVEIANSATNAIMITITSLAGVADTFRSLLFTKNNIISIPMPIAKPPICSIAPATENNIAKTILNALLPNHHLVNRYKDEITKKAMIDSCKKKVVIIIKFGKKAAIVMVIFFTLVSISNLHKIYIQE